jgi:hypothetical protein
VNARITSRPIDEVDTAAEHTESGAAAIYRF